MVLGGILAIVRVIFLFKIRFSVKKKKGLENTFFMETIILRPYKVFYFIFLN